MNVRRALGQAAGRGASRRMINGKASPMLFAFIYWDVESEVPGCGELELLVRRLLPGARWSAWSGPVKAAKKRETLTSKVAEQVRAELGKLLHEGVERISTRELRRRMKEAQERAQEEAKKEPGQEQKEQEASGKEVEVDFDLKETGQKRSIAGYDAREVIMTVTVREKGKTLEDAGGLVMTTDSWLGPDIPAMKELAEFEQRYWKAIAPETAGMSAEQMAAVMAMYPMIKQAVDRMNRENVKLDGTPLATTMTFEAVKSKEQMAQNQNSGGGGGRQSMSATLQSYARPAQSRALLSMNGVLSYAAPSIGLATTAAQNCRSTFGTGTGGSKMRGCRGLAKPNANVIRPSLIVRTAGMSLMVCLDRYRITRTDGLASVRST